MKIKDFTIKIKLMPSLLVVVALFLVYGFSTSEEIEVNEYLTILVEYNHGAQLFYICEGFEEPQKLASIPKDMVIATKRKLKRKGFKILDQKLERGNNTLFKMLNSYEAEGWKLNSHSMGIVVDEGFLISKEKTFQYLMTRKAR